MIKTITFKNAKNETITGILKQKHASAPLIIVCHGYKSSNNHPAIESITDKLYQMGNTTFSFNFSKSAQGANLIQQVSDLNDIVAHFKTYKKKILLAGSFGSLSSAIAVSIFPKVTGLITINGFFGEKKLGLLLLKEYALFRLISLFNKKYKDIWNYLKKNFAPEKIFVHTLIMHARNDKEVFMSQSKNFYNKLTTEKKFHILEYADHHLTRDQDRSEAAKEIDKWIKNLSRGQRTRTSDLTVPNRAL